ncbi:MAG TPA: hypothetical protein VFL90_13070 [Methylomirabilota bacterium]|nr:hypothetical protein [Methylomirabilota bacterium]
MSKPIVIAEYWRCKPTGALWAVRLIDGQVTAAAGPLADADLTGDDDDTTIELLRYLPYSERDARWVAQHRADLVREPHRGPLHAEGEPPARPREETC